MHMQIKSGQHLVLVLSALIPMQFLRTLHHLIMHSYETGAKTINLVQSCKNIASYLKRIPLVVGTDRRG